MASHESIRIVMSGNESLSSARAVKIGGNWDEFISNIREVFMFPAAMTIQLFSNTGAQVATYLDAQSHAALIVCLEEEEFNASQGLVDEIVKFERDTLMDIYSPIKETFKEYQTALEVIDIAISSLDASFSEVKSTISKSFDDIIQAIMKRRDQLISELEDIKKKKASNLSAQKKAIVDISGNSRQYATLESKINAKAGLDFGAIHSQLTSMKESFEKSSLSLSPCEDNSLGVDLPNNLYEPIATYGRVFWTEGNESARKNPEAAGAENTHVHHTFGHIRVDIEGGPYHTSEIVITASSSSTNIAHFTYQWQRQEPNSTFSPIIGATKSKYQPTANDLHANLRVDVTPITETGMKEKVLSVDIPTTMLTLDANVKEAVENNIFHGECIFDLYRRQTSAQLPEERSLWFSLEGLSIKKDEQLMSLHEYGLGIRAILPVSDPNLLILHLDSGLVEELICPSALYRDILAITIRSFNTISMMKKGLRIPTLKPLEKIHEPSASH